VHLIELTVTNQLIFKRQMDIKGMS